MQTACLVIAYDAAPVLRSALGIYLSLGWDVFVHLDPKADASAYRTALGERGERCRFVDDPVAVFWGGYSMMQAEFKLIVAALSTGSYDRFVLLSDNSFPFRSPSEIMRMLSENVNRITMLRQPENSAFYMRYHGFFYFDHKCTNPRGGIDRQIDQSLGTKVNEALQLQQIGKKAIEVYFGSQFWILQRETIVQVVNIFMTDLHLRKSFEFAALSDELMIQSICGNYLAGAPYIDGPVFADFSRGHGPLIYSSFDQLPQEIPQHAMFIRKMDSSAERFLQELEIRVAARGWTGLSPAAPARVVSVRRTTNNVAGRADLALNKPAMQSSISPWSHGRTEAEDARGANVEAVHDDYGFCTAREASPWWQVDLEDVFAISEIEIVNRRDCRERLRHFSVLGSVDGESWKILYTKHDQSVFDTLPLRLRSGGDAVRYLRVRLDATDFLHFRSFKAFGQAVGTAAAP